MKDTHYPSVDIQFLNEQLSKLSNLLKIIEVGDSTLYVLNGSKPIMKRSFNIRNVKSGTYDFEKATSIAIRAKFMGELLKWLEVNRKWKDGAYFK